MSLHRLLRLHGYTLARFICLAGILWVIGSTVHFVVTLPTLAIATSGPPAPTSSPPSASLSLEGLARITGLPVPTKPSDLGEAVAESSEVIPLTHLPLRLVGTLVGEERWALATVQSINSQKTRSYPVGGELEGAEVVSIERKRVTLRNQGRLEALEFSDVPVATLAYAGTAPSTANESASVGIGSSLKATGDGEFTIRKDDVDGAMSHLNELSMMMRALPNFKNGVASGFKLFAVKKDSLFARLGVQNGDVIRRINGYELNSLEQGFEVLSKLKDTRRVDLELERSGAAVKKSVRIEP